MSEATPTQSRGHQIGAPTTAEAARRVAELGAETSRELRADGLTPDEGAQWGRGALSVPDAQTFPAIREARESTEVAVALERALEAFPQLDELERDLDSALAKIRADPELSARGKDQRTARARQEHGSRAERIIVETIRDAASGLDRAFGGLRADVKAATPAGSEGRQREQHRQDALVLVQASGASNVLQLLENLMHIAHPSLPEAVELVSLLPGVPPVEAEALLRRLRRSRLERWDRALRAGDSRLPLFVKMALVDRVRARLRSLAEQLLDDPFDRGRRSMLAERVRKAADA